MTEQHDYVALEWVKGEIAETLKEARTALDAFIDGPRSDAAMAQCLNCLHQVHGSLTVLAFAGAERLAEELEQLAIALASGEVERQADAVQWLHRAFELLPAYLERVHLARADLPEVLLPLLNDLRAARGVGPLHEPVEAAQPLLEQPVADLSVALPDRDAMRSVVGALCEELVRVKEQLDLFVHGDRQQWAELGGLLPALRQIADTLAVLGFAQPRKVITDQAALLHSLAQGQQPPADAVLQDVAGALLYVEATLAGMVGHNEPSNRADLSQIRQLVIREARFGLQQAKDLIVDYIESQWDRQRMEPLPALLTQLRGALAMVPLPRAAALLAQCNGYISTHLLAEPDQPGWAQLDNLADAISSIEYYLERLGEDAEAPDEPLLDLAERSLLALAPARVDASAPVTPPPALDLQALANVFGTPASALDSPVGAGPASSTLLESDAAVDEDLRDVFLEETAELLEILREQWPQWLEHLEQHGPLVEMRRAFHTLKGSGRMVRAEVVGELAWAVENLLNRVIERRIAAGPEVLDLVEEALELLPEVIDEFGRGQARPRDDVDGLAERAQALALGNSSTTAAKVALRDDGLDASLLEVFRSEAATHLASLDAFLGAVDGEMSAVISNDLLRALHTLKGSASVAGVLPIAELMAPLDRLVRELKAHQLPLEIYDIHLLETAEALLRMTLSHLPVAPLALIDGAAGLISEVEQRLAQRLEGIDTSSGAERQPLLSSFLNQGLDILLEAESLLQQWREHPGSRHELTTLLDELTTLGEGAHLADLASMDDLCEALLDVYGAVEESSLAVSDRFFAEAALAHEALIGMLDQLAVGQQVQAQPERLAALRNLLDGALDPAATGLIDQGGRRIRDIGEAAAPIAPAANDELLQMFLEEATDILDSADTALQRWLAEPDVRGPLAALQRDLNSLGGGARLAHVDAVAVLAEALEALYEGMLERYFNVSPAARVVLPQAHRQLRELLDTLPHGAPPSELESLLDALDGLREAAPEADPAGPDTAAASEGADPELLEVFLEEGFDIVESSGAALLRWRAEPGNSIEVENLLRDLHTLKGGARMVEIAPIGDLAHELEYLYEQLSSGVRQADVALFSVLQGGHDRLAQMLEAVRAGEPLPAADVLIKRARDWLEGPPAAVLAAPPVPALAPAERARSTAEPTGLGADMVKVPGDLLESLGNLAGETSILHGRIEQQVEDAQAALHEMETTIERMRDQLRRLDTETQGRILSRQHADHERQGYEDFDPLEMDRHSQLQQLSRALFESASDLLDLKETLAVSNQDAQALLQLQARVNTDLQEGLMRTRMVPFERMVPRLRRVVRQVAAELGKDVELQVLNAQGELDRSVLERMLAPLEHMLRNAVDHGLEPTAERILLGKPAQGSITLELLHDGADMVIEVSDDGAGVPLQAVRQKAIARGLIDADSELSDHDVLQFILEPGFSTAAKITQISGRGLGMDVVHEEVKQLGGAMSIDSAPGKGARFHIRLPFTVSVNRALMVQCADAQYAIPLNTIEGIVRVLPTELEACYPLAPPRYEYAGRRFDLHYLDQLLHARPRVPLLGQSEPLPVLLVQAHDQQVAVQVDAILGAREIVVKSLGPAFAQVAGLSGATILGDGNVVLILDLPGQLRALHLRHAHQIGRHGQAAPPATDSEPVRKKLVMVVDDSVTVRKVTGRLLERHGMSVLTAKDGVDAMALLQEHRPDIVLLDIEMPRMDGFEVATRIRQDSRTQHLPIIMITSRTGQKHRDRALAVGVNEYLGKPYQEAQLLQSIQHWSEPHG
ncbi:Hpt domain-containing protein [Pseudomonas sp. nanlin1]|uniref:hybrid sensor histidine kinase/response regulator n=1 Tax=Pseudomonas sp. nanlin1 TaxID=3040605 RepID=UPI00388DF5E4